MRIFKPWDGGLLLLSCITFALVLGPFVPAMSRRNSLLFVNIFLDE